MLTECTIYEDENWNQYVEFNFNPSLLCTLAQIPLEKNMNSSLLPTSAMG